MPEEKLEEETYSLIFTSLKHPIRRRILRMLANKLSTFSEILESLSIDSGHLSYHLENLGELIVRSPDGKYELSSIGIAAVKLMSGVEEHPATPSRKESKKMQGVINVYVVILVGTLIAASLYFANFTVATLPPGGESAFTWPGMPILVHPRQAFEYNVTMVYKQGMTIRVWENNSLYHERAPPISTLTAWEIGWFWLDLESNETYDIVITFYSPDGTVMPARETNLAAGSTTSSPRSEINQAGTYKFEIKNVGFQELHALVRVNEEWHLFEKPYFYYGIAGLFVALFYPLVILFKLLKNWAFSPKS